MIIKKHIKGKPLVTNSIVNEPLDIKISELNEMEIDSSPHSEGIKLKIKLDEKDYIYGLGENLGGINKRGRKYESYCTDEALHIESKEKLYGSHNFFVISRENFNLGVFIDCPSRINYDLGFSIEDEININIYNNNFNIYTIESLDVNNVISTFLKLIGKSYIPPKWAFGNFQSRWGYKDRDEIDSVYKKYRENDLPLEGIFLDLDYMDDFKNFTYSSERFSNFKDYVNDYKKEGMYLVPIIDAGVKVEDGYDIYEEGVSGDHFVKDIKGEPYSPAVWPGKVHFPDFFQTKTQSWFGDKYKFLIDNGIEGVWNDMNEPAIFYDDTTLNEAIELAEKSKNKNLNVIDFFNLKDKFSGLINNLDYHERFFHNIEGKNYIHKDVHNLYGYYMTKSANIGLEKHLKKRFLLISRASHIGMHRYSGIWTGDNSSWWSHIEENIKMMPSINMCGFYYIGSDTGGFSQDASGELMTRWLQFSIFTPLLRNHSALDTLPQEPYRYSEKTINNIKNILKSRYKLIPYIYSEFIKNVNRSSLLFRPLSFEYGNEFREIEDQILFSNEIMITPVYKQNKSKRVIELPEKMANLKIKDGKESISLYDKGIIDFKYPKDEVNLFIRKDKIIPIVDDSNNTKNLSYKKVKFFAYIVNEARYDLYDDDGISYEFKDGIHYNTEIIIRKSDNNENSSNLNVSGYRLIKYLDYEIEIFNNNQKIEEVEINIIDENGTLSKINI